LTQQHNTMIGSLLTAGVINALLRMGHGFSTSSSFAPPNRQQQLRWLTTTKGSRSRGRVPFFPLMALSRNEPETVSTVEVVNGNGAVQKKDDEKTTKILSDLGFDASNFKHTKKIPSIRPVSSNDVFCNRDLRLGGVDAIGFDMDYTLAQYHQPAFDELAFNGAKEKLVHVKGYPEEVLDWEYDHTFWTRGLIIDTQRGNFLKIDRHKYVKVAHHGFNRMSARTRKHLYSKAFNKVISFTEKNFVNMDTLFQYVDAHLFAGLVDLKDEEEHDMLNMKTYEEIYREVRECVDLCHRDGVIKDEVARSPDPFIVKDPQMLPMLRRFKEDGVKVFLLTNSYWEYTSTVMNYLYYGERVDDEKQKENEWLELFDLVIVGSCKPAFMLDPYLNLFRVNPQDGRLENTDGVYEIDALGSDGASQFLSKGKTFQGGNWLHLQALLETKAGDEILYVGDHLYSDVLRSKRTLGWRSAFVVPELADEMRVFNENLPLYKKISTLRRMRDELDMYADEVRSGVLGLGDEKQEEVLREIAEEEAEIKGLLVDLANEWHAAFHPIWGALFNTGYQDSRFAFYVQNYACLYTSQASNLGLVSTIRSFRASADILPHDRLMLDEENSAFVQFQDPFGEEVESDSL